MRALIDVCGDGVLELAMAEFIENGEVERHGRRLGRIYRRRRDVLVEHLERRLGGVLQFDLPRGGSALYPSINVAGWAKRVCARGRLSGRPPFFPRRARGHRIGSALAGRSHGAGAAPGAVNR